MANINNIKPNLFIIGAAKSGTTSIHHYLSQHAKISMSKVKEPHFFSDIKNPHQINYSQSSKDKSYHARVVKNIDDYLSLFDYNADSQYYGEASPSYLYDENSAGRIFKFNPNAKILIILREPVSRAYSHYKMMCNRGGENEKNLLSAIKKDIEDKDKIWGGAHLYVEIGLYYKQIARYFELFPAQNIYILKFEDFVANEKIEVNKIFDFLNIEHFSAQEFQKQSKNEAVEMKGAFKKALFLLRRMNLLKTIRKVIPASVKHTLHSLFLSNKRNVLVTEGKNINSENFDALNAYFFEDKQLLKKYYNISWE